MIDDQDEGATLTAFAASFKRTFNLQGSESLLAKFRVVDTVDNNGKSIELVSEATEVHDESGVTSFRLRWDRPRQWNDGDQLRVERETNRVRVRLREGATGPMAFIYTNVAMAPTASPQVSYALFRTYGQLTGIEATSGLFAWLLANHVGHVLHGGFKVTGIKDLQYVSLSGDIKPEDSMDWKRYMGKGQLRSLRYETVGGDRRFSAHFRGIYSVEGDGVTEADLEAYVLETVIPHLTFKAKSAQS